MAYTPFNNGSNIPDPRDEDLINADGVDLTDIPDIGLTSGSNPDGALNLNGDVADSGFNLNISNYVGNFTEVLERQFNELVGDFGVGGLLGIEPQQVDTDVAPKIQPSTNVLHDYATYTYRITLGAQDIRDHQEIASGDFIRGIPKITTMMMASGGGQAVDGVTRDPIFAEDFYIEDVEIATIVGLNERGNGSNNVWIEFKIIEPYAVSLIERLLALANKLGYNNYIEIPYIFKIEFIGYDDAGNQIGTIPQTTKYIPFKLMWMDFVTKGQGAMYSVTAVPTNHFAFKDTIEALPQGAEIAAGTVEEFFNGKQTGNSGINNREGLANTINAFHANLASKSSTAVDTPEVARPRNAADRVKFVIHPSIGNTNLVVGNLSKVSMILEERNRPGSAAVREGYAVPGKPTYGFHAGTAISKVINEIVKNSTFWTSQIEEHERIDAQNQANEDLLQGDEKARGVANRIKKKPLIHYKITSTYRMLEYDPKANRHAYEATYFVTPFQTSGHASPNISDTDPTTVNVAKEYNYLYTGANQDILDLNLEFNYAFYNEVASNTESVTEGTPAGNNKAISGANPGDNLPQSGDPVSMTPQEYRPPSARDNTGTAAKEDRKKLKAAAVERSIMQDSQGDMLNLEMTILGDPAFIKQDDILYAPESEDSSDPLTENGSIKQDTGDLNIRMRFKVFDDIDHETGLRAEGRQIPNSTFNRRSTFDGVYRLITLDNKFSRGSFTQTLRGIRHKVQITDTDPSTTQLASADSSLVNVDSNAREQAIAGNTGDLLNTETLTQAQQVAESQKQLSGVITANTFDPSADAVVNQPISSAQDIVDISTTNPINADRR